jgi:hypothetical protein
MPENAENEDKIAAAGSQQEAVQASDANAEATAKASDELTENDLEAVAGGVRLDMTPMGLVPVHQYPSGRRSGRTLKPGQMGYRGP